MKNNYFSFVGLGVMGYPMAGHLSKLPHTQMRVYNRTPKRALNWLDSYQGTSAPTPKEAVEDADFVMVCVGNDRDLEDVILGPDGVLAGLKPGAVVVDHTTVATSTAIRIGERVEAKGAYFLDAPVSGGQAGAENGKLTIMVGGNADAFARVRPYLEDSYGLKVTHMGPLGAGQTTKMVNQICIAGTLQGLAEALNFGMHAGLDMDKVLDVISKGAAGSWQMENRGKTMVRDQFDFGFALDWMIKDLNNTVEEGEALSADLTVTRQILDYYRELSARGLGRMDTSALIKRITE